MTNHDPAFIDMKIYFKDVCIHVHVYPIVVNIISVEEKTTMIG